MEPELLERLITALEIGAKNLSKVKNRKEADEALADVVSKLGLTKESEIKPWKQIYDETILLKELAAELRKMRIRRQKVTEDQLELKVSTALSLAGIKFTQQNTKRLDFYLPQYATYIEVKQMYSPRIGEQLQRVKDAIVLQGHQAVHAFCRLVVNKGM